VAQVMEAGVRLASASGAAAFSPCGRYRWWLERRFVPAGAEPGGRILFIGLNPSAAAADHDDPTLRRLQGFARGWGFGSLEVVNLFGRITASPAVLRRLPEPVGEQNDRWIAEGLSACDAVWLGWGNGGLWRDRHQEVLQLISDTAATVPVGCIGFTAAGQPRHPLYAPAASEWRPWATGSTLRHPVPSRSCR
jgi:hypothetical protein